MLEGMSPSPSNAMSSTTSSSARYAPPPTAPSSASFGTATSSTGNPGGVEPAKRSSAQGLYPRGGNAGTGSCTPSGKRSSAQGSCPQIRGSGGNGITGTGKLLGWEQKTAGDNAFAVLPLTIGDLGDGKNAAFGTAGAEDELLEELSPYGPPCHHCDRFCLEGREAPPRFGGMMKTKLTKLS